MSEQTPFEKRSQEMLDESTARLDGHTLSRLTQARHAALEQRQQPARQRWRTFVPAGAAAVAVLAVVMWSGNPGVGTGVAEPASSTAMEDIDLLADTMVDADAPDFLSDSDDLEFYEWAAGEVES
jgi:hypothetical protein